MAFRHIATGLQHIGIPTNDMEKTIAFYTALGFETVCQTVMSLKSTIPIRAIQILMGTVLRMERK